MTYTITYYSCAEQIRRLGFNNDPNWISPEARNGRVTIKAIQEAVAESFGIPLAEMTSDRRFRAVARPRQVAMYLSKSLTSKTLPEIGRRFGGRDHTTVMHAIRQVERLRSEDSELSGQIDRVADAVCRPPFHPPLFVPAEPKAEPASAPQPVLRAWCGQCESSVLPGEAGRCENRWCQVKSFALRGEAAR